MGKTGGLLTAISVGAAASSNVEDPVWGCGMLGHIPGIDGWGNAEPETRRLLNSLKNSSTYGMVSYWNWDFAPQAPKGGKVQYLTTDTLFTPNHWGVTPIEQKRIRQPGMQPYIAENNIVSVSQMSDLLLGANEPDIAGSCMGNMFGKCTISCSQGEAASCPKAFLLSKEPAEPNPRGACNCWEHSHATGVGFWDVPDCGQEQPLPKLFQRGYENCRDVVMDYWRNNAKIAANHGYKYLTTPMIAVHMDYLEKWVELTCGDDCQDISCGCPQYLAWHFYGTDCRPHTLGNYKEFQKKLDASARIMERFPMIKGVHINEVGMLNCPMTSDNPICTPDSGKYPAKDLFRGTCPSTQELPEGMVTFMNTLMDMATKARTRDGRRVVKGFTWFALNKEGGTYNLRLFDDDGKVNPLGEAYMRKCAAWGEELGIKHKASLHRQAPLPRAPERTSQRFHQPVHPPVHQRVHQPVHQPTRSNLQKLAPQGLLRSGTGAEKVGVRVWRRLQEQLKKDCGSASSASKVWMYWEPRCATTTLDGCNAGGRFKECKHCLNTNQYGRCKVQLPKGYAAASLQR